MNNDTNNYNIDNMEIQAEEVQETSSSNNKSKKRKKKKRRKKYYLLRFIVFILVCVGAYFFIHSSVFTVEKIHLEKNDRFSKERVMEMAGLKKGVNMFEIKMGDMEDALEENAYIREADVKREIPDTISISLDLRQPVAVVKKNGKFIMLDREGHVLEIRKKLPHYTFFDGITVEKAKVGQVVKVKEEKKYQQYMKLVDKMNSADLYFRKIAVEDDTIKLYPRLNLYCVGSSDNIMAGLEDGNLKAVLYNLSKKGVEKGVVTVGDNRYYSFSRSVK